MLSISFAYFDSTIRRLTFWVGVSSPVCLGPLGVKELELPDLLDPGVLLGVLVDLAGDELVHLVCSRSGPCGC